MAKDIQQKARLSLAKKAVKSGKFTSERKAAIAYNVSRSTLQGFLKRDQQGKQLARKTGKLTKLEEKALIQWIINMDTRGAPPRPPIVKDMANILLSQRNQSDTKSTVGKNWV